MVLLGLTSDSRTIHVRMDDLLPRERDQVHECVDIVDKLKKQKVLGRFVGVMTFLGIMLAVLIGIPIAEASGAKLTEESLVGNIVGNTFLAALVIGAVAALFVAKNAKTHMKEGIQMLTANRKSSPRCDDFMSEYVEDCAVIKRILADKELNVVPAT